MRQYLDLLEHVLTTGVVKSDRTGTGTRSVFGYQMRYDLNDGFPVLTTKRLHLRSIIGELVWFLRGETNIGWLRERGITIWDEWADENGDLGPVYGHQWRSWPTPDGGKIDQIAGVIESIRTNPDSRRHIVSAWNVADVAKMALPPCHTMFQFYVRPATGRDDVSLPTRAGEPPTAAAPTGVAQTGATRQATLDSQNSIGHGGDEAAAQGAAFLDCQLYQRSADIFLGVPFNIASYALLTMIVAQLTGLRPGHFVHTLGDAHLYSNHLEQAHLQLTRTPGPLPTMRITHRDRIDDYDVADFNLIGYEAAPNIKAPISV